MASSVGMSAAEYAEVQLVNLLLNELMGADHILVSVYEITRVGGYEHRARVESNSFKSPTRAAQRVLGWASGEVVWSARRSDFDGTLRIVVPTLGIEIGLMH